jgi:glycosyltransferase involved in cell wall biosynthesis
MRLAHATHQYWPAVGGAEQHITDLSEEMVRRGHQVTVYTCRSRDYQTWKTDLPGRERMSGVDVRRFRSLRRRGWTWRVLASGYAGYWRTCSRRYEPLIWLGNGPVCPGLVWSLLRHAGDVDLVHINNLHYAHAAAAYAVARRRGLPVVLTPHVHVEQRATYDVGYMWTMLRHSDHVLADTDAEREFLIESGLDPWRVTTAGVGLRPEELRILDRDTCRRDLGLPAGAFVVLFLGRKTEYKGLDVVLEAFGRLQEAYPLLYVLAIGPETTYSEALWAGRGEHPRLMNYANAPDEVRLAALNACDCLALPSTGEAFGRVFLEAWAAGKPVIGARTQAVSSLIADGRDGYLVAPGSASDVADRVRCLLDGDGLAREMGARGRAKVMRRYTVSRIGDIVEGAYLRVVRRRHFDRTEQRLGERE